MAPLAPTKIWTKKEKTKKKKVDNIKVTPLAPIKIRTEKEKIKKQIVEPDSESSSAEDEDKDKDEGSHLHGFSTDDDDSSDEEDAMDDGPSEFDVSKLPTIAKDDATVKHKLDKAKRQPVRLLFLLIIHLLLIPFPDRRPWRLVYWTSASRVLRRPTQGLLFTIWQCYQATRLSQ